MYGGGCWAGMFSCCCRPACKILREIPKMVWEKWWCRACCAMKKCRIFLHLGNNAAQSTAPSHHILTIFNKNYIIFRPIQKNTVFTLLYNRKTINLLSSNPRDP